MSVDILAAGILGIFGMGMLIYLSYTAGQWSGQAKVYREWEQAIKERTKR